jgi:hypothetical protein
MPHAKTLCDRLHGLFLEQDLCDATISLRGRGQNAVGVEDGTKTAVVRRAHIVVLAAMSPVLREKIRDASRNGVECGVVELDEDADAFDKVLGLVYTGIMDTGDAEAMRCACALQIFGLEQILKNQTAVKLEREAAADELLSGSGRKFYFDDNLTIKTEMSGDDEDLDFFEDSDGEWDPILAAPELILHEQSSPSAMSLMGSGDEDYPTLNLNIALPGEDDSLGSGLTEELEEEEEDGSTEAELAETEERPAPEKRPTRSTRTKRGRPKGSNATTLPKRARVLLPPRQRLLVPPVQLYDENAVAGNNKKYLCSLCGRTLTGLTAYNRHQVSRRFDSLIIYTLLM